MQSIGAISNTKNFFHPRRHYSATRVVCLHPTQHPTVTSEGRDVFVVSVDDFDGVKTIIEQLSLFTEQLFDFFHQGPTGWSDVDLDLHVFTSSILCHTKINSQRVISRLSTPRYFVMWGRVEYNVN